MQFLSGCVTVFLTELRNLSMNLNWIFIHVFFSNADTDSDGHSSEAYGAMEDSSHRCVSNSWSGHCHWLDYIFFVPL